MAKLNDLIDALTNTLGLPRTTVESYAKPLRKEGLIASSGRSGPGAPNMTPDDAASLLIGILAGSPTQAAERVKTYANLAWEPQGKIDENIPLATFRNFFGLQRRHTIRDLLVSVLDEQGRHEALFTFLSHLALYAAKEEGIKIPDHSQIEELHDFLWSTFSPYVLLEFTTTAPTATFTLEVLQKDTDEVIYARSASYDSNADATLPLRQRLWSMVSGENLHRSSDFTVKQMISSFTLLRVADTLFPCPVTTEAWKEHDGKR